MRRVFENALREGWFERGTGGGRGFTRYASHIICGAIGRYPMLAVLDLLFGVWLRAGDYLGGSPRGKTGRFIGYRVDAD